MNHIKIKLDEKKWTHTRYKNLLEQIDLCRPKWILEIGTWIGTTAARMVKHARQYREDVYYIGLDLFEHITVEEAEWQNHTKKNAVKKQTEAYLNQEIGRENYFLIQGMSEQVSKKLKVSLMEQHFGIHTVDFAFIDGGHAVETILKDWMLVESMMRDDTIVIFDDYYEGEYTIGAAHVVDYAIDLKFFNVEKLQPVDMFKFPDGRPQPTQMVKVTRKKQSPEQTPEYNRDYDDSKSHNPYLQESDGLDDGEL